MREKDRQRRGKRRIKVTGKNRGRNGVTLLQTDNQIDRQTTGQTDI